jgi:hypothetical protein
MGSPAANHAGHTCGPEAIRGTGMWHYGAILVGKSPTRLEMAGRTPGGSGARAVPPAVGRVRGWSLVAGQACWPVAAGVAWITPKQQVC